MIRLLLGCPPRLGANGVASRTLLGPHTRSQAVAARHRLGHDGLGPVCGLGTRRRRSEPASAVETDANALEGSQATLEYPVGGMSAKGINGAGLEAFIGEGGAAGKGKKGASQAPTASVSGAIKASGALTRAGIVGPSLERLQHVLGVLEGQAWGQGPVAALGEELSKRPRGTLKKDLDVLVELLGRDPSLPPDQWPALHDCAKLLTPVLRRFPAPPTLTPPPTPKPPRPPASSPPPPPPPTPISPSTSSPAPLDRSLHGRLSLLIQQLDARRPRSLLTSSHLKNIYQQVLSSLHHDLKRQPQRIHNTRALEDLRLFLGLVEEKELSDCITSDAYANMTARERRQVPEEPPLNLPPRVLAAREALRLLFSDHYDAHFKPLRAAPVASTPSQATLSRKERREREGAKPRDVKINQRRLAYLLGDIASSPPPPAAKLEGRPMSASLWQRHVSRFTKAAATNFNTMNLPPHRIERLASVLSKLDGARDVLAHHNDMAKYKADAERAKANKRNPPPRPVMSPALLEARALVCELLCETITAQPLGLVSREPRLKSPPPPLTPSTTPTLASPPSATSATSERRGEERSSGGGPIVIDAAAWAKEGGYGLEEALVSSEPELEAHAEGTAVEEEREEGKGEGEGKGEVDMEALKDRCDLRLPHEWYPYARLMKRKIIYHGGPTNSGKTYHALQRLKAADPEKGGGIYLGPLRLLALEVYEQLNEEGVYCSLRTGQEKREVPFAAHVSATMETLRLHEEVDVAVIDEIQMIAHPERGHAWTRALLGLRAREVHLCGGSEAMDCVKALLQNTQDELEIREYDRLTPLQVEDGPLLDYGKVQAGDCIVAFSKADIYAIKKDIEAKTGHRCCVVYGQLPPETRSQQARLFNDPTSGYDILVASDAIGMGLNLNIRRIIFHSLLKTAEEGGAERIEPGYVKQIGGRAGRRSSQWQGGSVTCLREEDMAYLTQAMHHPVQQIQAAGLYPSVEQLEDFCRRLYPSPGPSLPPPQASLTHVLQRFMALAQLSPSGHYFLCHSRSVNAIADYLSDVPHLSMADRFILASVPLNRRDRLAMQTLYQFALAHAHRRPIPPTVRVPQWAPRSILAMNELCTKHAILDVYLWLGQHFPSSFPQREQAEGQRRQIMALIQHGLTSEDVIELEHSLDDRDAQLRGAHDRAMQRKAEGKEGREEGRGRGRERSRRGSREGSGSRGQRKAIAATE